MFKEERKNLFFKMYWVSITTVFTVTKCVEAVPRYKEPTTNYTISELDEGVTNLLLSKEEGKGNELYQLLYTLHLRMLHIHEVFHFNVDDPPTLADGKEIVMKGGLKLFKVSVDEKSLKDVYKYKQAEVYETEDLVKNCQRLYNSTEPIIRKRYNL